MLTGYPPFYSEEPNQTCLKIMEFDGKGLEIPQNMNISQPA